MAPPQAKDEVRHSASPDIESLVYNDEHEVRGSLKLPGCGLRQSHRTSSRSHLSLPGQGVAAPGRAGTIQVYGAMELWCIDLWHSSLLCLLVRVALGFAGGTCSNAFVDVSHCSSPHHPDRRLVPQTHHDGALVNDPAASSLFIAAFDAVDTAPGSSFPAARVCIALCRRTSTHKACGVLFFLFLGHHKRPDFTHDDAMPT